MAHPQRPPPQRQYAHTPHLQNDGWQNQAHGGYYDPRQQNSAYDVHEGYQYGDDQGSYHDGHGAYEGREQYAPKPYHNQSRDGSQYQYEYSGRYHTNPPPDPQQSRIDRQNFRPAPLQQWPRPCKSKCD